MTGISTLIFMDRTVVSIAAPDIIRDLHLSETAMGSVFSAFFGAYTASMFASGALCDRFGARRVLAAGATGVAVCAVLTAACGWMWFLPSGAVLYCLIAARAGSGACAAPLYPACAKLTGAWFPATMTARVQSLIFGVTLLGAGIVPMIGAPFIARFGWTNAFLALAGFLACGSILWRRFVRDAPLSAPADRTSSAPARLRGAVLTLTASYGAFCYFGYLLESWAFYYYREIRDFGLRESAMYVSAMLIAGALATPVGGWISDRLSIRFGPATGRRMVPIAGISLSVVFCAIGAAGLAPLITAVALALSYAFLSACDAIFWAVTIETTGERSGAACGLMNTGGNGGGMLSPVITPMIAAQYGWTLALCAGGVVALFALTPWVSKRTVFERPAGKASASTSVRSSRRR
jgi:MFS family permease